jgi:hypothetical protein
MAAVESQQVISSEFQQAETKSPDCAEVNARQLASALSIARKNWKDWRDVFEHKGAIYKNPLLAEPGKRFSAFCKEYSVHRTIRAGTQQSFRRELARSRAFLDAITAGSGYELDAIEQDLRTRFGTHTPPRRMISVVSKIAAFLKPDQFVAWDQYARRGVNVLLGRSQNFVFDGYGEYLSAFDTIWNAVPGSMIREYVAGNGTNVEKDTRFLRRVLDVYAMKRGGRWPD